MTPSVQPTDMNARGWWQRHDLRYAALALALVVGLALRLYGIYWGLPDVSHPAYSYHPDETVCLIWATWLPRGDIIANHFEYGGTFYFTILDAIAYFAHPLAKALDGANSTADAILLGRYFLVALALLTILLVFEIGCRLFDWRVGAAAALFLAITPAHIVWAQRLRPDEIAAFFAALILYTATVVLQSHPQRRERPLVIAGLVLGIAAGLRLPLVVLGTAPLAAYFIVFAPVGWRGWVSALVDRRFFFAGAATLVGYTVASPHSFMYPEAFLAGLRVQWHYQSQAFPDAVGMGPGAYQYGWLMLHQALGYALYGLAFAGLIHAMHRRTPPDWVLLGAIVPYFVITSFTSWVVVRYTLPLLPPLVLLAARFVVNWLDARPRARAATCAVLVLGIAWTVAADLAYLRVAAGKNIRDEATQWLTQNISPGASILTVKTYVEDYYLNPVIPRAYNHIIFYLWKGNDSEAMFRAHFDYLILHEQLYYNMERLSDRHPLKPAWIFYRSLLASPYKLIKQFDRPPKLLGIDFSSSFSSNDYTLLNPGIRVYAYRP